MNYPSDKNKRILRYRFCDKEFSTLRTMRNYLIETGNLYLNEESLKEMDFVDKEILAFFIPTKYLRRLVELYTKMPIEKMDTSYYDIIDDEMESGYSQHYILSCLAVLEDEIAFNNGKKKMKAEDLTAFQNPANAALVKDHNKRAEACLRFYMATKAKLRIPPEYNSIPLTTTALEKIFSFDEADVCFCDLYGEAIHPFPSVNMQTKKYIVGPTFFTVLQRLREIYNANIDKDRWRLIEIFRKVNTFINDVDYKISNFEFFASVLKNDMSIFFDNVTKNPHNLMTYLLTTDNGVELAKKYAEYLMKANTIDPELEYDIKLRIAMIRAPHVLTKLMQSQSLEDGVSLDFITAQCRHNGGCDIPKFPGKVYGDIQEMDKKWYEWCLEFTGEMQKYPDEYSMTQTAVMADNIMYEAFDEKAFYLRIPLKYKNKSPEDIEMSIERFLDLYRNTSDTSALNLAKYYSDALGRTLSNYEARLYFTNDMNIFLYYYNKPKTNSMIVEVQEKIHNNQKNNFAIICSKYKKLAKMLKKADSETNELRVIDVLRECPYMQEHFNTVRNQIILNKTLTKDERDRLIKWRSENQGKLTQSTPIDIKHSQYTIKGHECTEKEMKAAMKKMYEVSGKSFYNAVFMECLREVISESSK